MLSRMTNAVLMLAMVVLSIALWRSDRAQRVIDGSSPASADNTLARGFEPAANDVLLLSAAFAPFDAMELDQAAADSGNRILLDAGSRDGQNESAASTQELRHSDRDRRWRGADGAPLTEDMANRCLEVAREVDPEIARQLADARANNPEEFDRQIRAGGFGRRLLALAQLKTHDPILYGQKISELSSAIDIDRTARELRELRKSPETSLGKVEEVETKLRTLLQVQLAMSIKARGDMICRFEERLQRMKEDIEREARNFQSTIDARMNALLEESPNSDQPPIGASEKPGSPASGG